VAEWAYAGGECTLKGVGLRHFNTTPIESLTPSCALPFIKKHRHAEVVADGIGMRACEVSEC
jgi:hypothetical protein